MSKRRVQQGPDHDERVAAGSAPPASAKGTNVADRVLGLQRDYGNTAVTTMVQRKGGGKGGKKQAAKVENYLPEWDSSISSSAGELRQQAGPQLSGSEEWQIRKGIHWYEQAYLRETSDNVRRMDAKTLWHAYDKVGEGARAAWWKKVHTAEIDPFAGEKRHA